MITIQINNMIRRVILESSDTLLYHGSGMDFTKFSSGDVDPATGVSHHGKGTYLVDDRDTALAYISEYAVGGNGVLYTCSVSKLEAIEDWDAQIPMHIFMEMAEDLIDNNEDLSQEMTNYPEMYNGETFTFGELYAVLESVSGVNTNIFFMDYGIYGFTASNRINPDAIEFCILDTDIISITNKERIIGE